MNRKQKVQIAITQIFKEFIIDSCDKEWDCSTEDLKKRMAEIIIKALKINNNKACTPVDFKENWIL